MRGVDDRAVHDRIIKAAQHIERTRVVGGHDDMSSRVRSVGDEGFAIALWRAVMVKMIRFGVGDDGDGGLVFSETAVRLVGFCDEDAPGASMSAVKGLAVWALDGTANRVAGISQVTGACVHENMGQQRTGGGFAVCTGYGDRIMMVHEQCEDIAAMHDMRALGRRGDDLWIVRLDGAGIHHG